jgi:hypothetical protein
VHLFDVWDDTEDHSVTGIAERKFSLYFSKEPLLFEVRSYSISGTGKKGPIEKLLFGKYPFTRLNKRKT